MTQVRPISLVKRENQSEVRYLRPNLTVDEFLNATLSRNVDSPEICLTKPQLQARQVVSKDLPIFSGNSSDWPVFITMFAETTKQCGFTDAENVNRLMRCLKGEAYEAVKSELLKPNSLAMVLSTLKMLFGKPEIVFNTSLNDLRSLPSVNLDKPQTLVVLSMRLKNLVETSEIMNMVEYLNNPNILFEMVTKLPMSMRIEWGEYLRKRDARHREEPRPL